MRDHGGNLDWAIGRWGGSVADWVDLSTGINPHPFPVPTLSERAWTSLPTRSDMQGLVDAARVTYETRAEILPVSGAQAGIQMMPRLLTPGEMRVIGPTYNEHAASFEAAGWTVRTVDDLDALLGARVAVVVNPNNPDGQTYTPEQLRGIAQQVGLLIVDESFADPMPQCSLASNIPDNALVLRSFGKFYGLAGLRLGFVLGSAEWIEKLAAMSGPWPVSGAAIEIGGMALQDRTWFAETVQRLSRDCDWLDDLARTRGWGFVGGTPLFRLYETPDADAAQDRLAKGKVWSRRFPYSQTWLRLGLVPEASRAQVEHAFSAG